MWLVSYTGWLLTCCSVSLWLMEHTKLDIENLNYTHYIYIYYYYYYYYYITKLVLFKLGYRTRTLWICWMNLCLKMAMYNLLYPVSPTLRSVMSARVSMITPTKIRLWSRGLTHTRQKLLRISLISLHRVKIDRVQYSAASNTKHTISETFYYSWIIQIHNYEIANPCSILHVILIV